MATGAPLSGGMPASSGPIGVDEDPFQGDSAPLQGSHDVDDRVTRTGDVGVMPREVNLGFDDGIRHMSR
jgi:hypothetical protein